MAKLTDPQRRALQVLMRGPARYSNTTSAPDAPTRSLYSQVADRLVTAGLARFIDADVAMMDGRQVEITRAGRNAIAEG